MIDRNKNVKVVQYNRYGEKVQELQCSMHFVAINLLCVSHMRQNKNKWRKAITASASRSQKAIWNVQHMHVEIKDIKAAKSYLAWYVKQPKITHIFRAERSAA